MARLQHLDFFGGRRPSEEEALQFQAHVEEAADDRVVFLSDVWLDKPATHDRLRAIFEGTPPPVCLPRALDSREASALARHVAWQVISGHCLL